MVLYHHNRKVAKNTSLAHICKNERTWHLSFWFLFSCHAFQGIYFHLCTPPWFRISLGSPDWHPSHDPLVLLSIAGLISLWLVYLPLWAKWNGQVVCFMKYLVALLLLKQVIIRMCWNSDTGSSHHCWLELALVLVCELVSSYWGWAVLNDFKRLNLNDILVFKF